MRSTAGFNDVAVKSLRDIVLTGSPTKRSLVPWHAFYINALSYREYIVRTIARFSLNGS